MVQLFFSKNSQINLRLRPAKCGINKWNYGRSS